MKHLLHILEGRLQTLPVRMAVQLPAGQQLGARDAAVTLRFRDRMALVALASGEIGKVGAAIVEGKVALEGSMRALMAAAAGLLARNPVQDSRHHWWRQVLARARSMAVHSVPQDARQVQFHYDLSDDFYALWLDPRRVYSCAYFRDPTMTLARAQEAKLDLVCRKLRLQPGERFLDIGAGWGALLLWAAEHYGVDATGITVSRNQHAHVQQLIAARGLAGRVRVQLCDYRELQAEKPFDKVASVGMFEHVGRAKMRAYFATVRNLLYPGGLLLNHCITRPHNRPGNIGGFIDRYVFPDGELTGSGRIIATAQDVGLEVLHEENLRHHYALTLRDWCANLVRNWDDAVAEVGVATAKVWGMYMAGSRVGFETNVVQLHQVLAVKLDEHGADGGLPLRPWWTP